MYVLYLSLNLGLTAYELAILTKTIALLYTESVHRPHHSFCFAFVKTVVFPLCQGVLHFKFV